MSEIITTDVGDTVKVEILPPDSPVTLPNYGSAFPIDGGKRYAWHVFTGQSGTAANRAQAINNCARAIRIHSGIPLPAAVKVWELSTGGNHDDHSAVGIVEGSEEFARQVADAYGELVGERCYVVDTHMVRDDADPSDLADALYRAYNS